MHPLVIKNLSLPDELTAIALDKLVFAADQNTFWNPALIIGFQKFPNDRISERLGKKYASPVIPTKLTCRSGLKSDIFRYSLQHHEKNPL
jgi:hypothetical protein